MLGYVIDQTEGGNPLLGQLIQGVGCPGRHIFVEEGLPSQQAFDEVRGSDRCPGGKWFLQDEILSLKSS